MESWEVGRGGTASFRCAELGRGMRVALRRGGGVLGWGSKENSRFLMTVGGEGRIVTDNDVERGMSRLWVSEGNPQQLN